jgi:hypothetical protein
MLAYVEAVVSGVDDICIVKYARVTEAGDDSFNDLVDGLECLESGTVELIIVGNDSGV